MSESQRKTNEQFVNELKIKNPNIKPLTKYISAHTKINCKCIKHDYEFEYTPANLLAGKGCYLCCLNKKRQKKVYSNDKFLEILKSKSPHIIPLETYYDSKTAIKCLCSICGYTWSPTGATLLRGEGCPKCVKKAKKNTEIFKSEVFELEGDEYCVLSEYINANTEILMRHNKCGNEYLVSPHRFLSGNRCNKCRESKGEKKIRNYLDNHHYVYEREYVFDDCKNKRHLFFDFVIFKNEGKDKILFCLEFNGLQHYKPVNFFGGLKQWEYQKYLDSLKAEYCKQKGINLVVIHYNKINKIDKILDKMFFEVGDKI